MPIPKRKRNEEDGSKEGVKYRGVTRKGKRFMVQIRIDGKRHYLGTFDTSMEAAKVYDRAVIDLRRPISGLNFLDQVPEGYETKKKKLRSTNTIGYRGVYKKDNKFKAQICLGGKNNFLGYFDTTKEAAVAYDLAAIKAKRPRCDLNLLGEIDMRREEIPTRKKQELVRSHNTTGFKGVSKRGNMFVAHVTINGQRKYIGNVITTSRGPRMLFTT
mgnify:CR=1 FL=1